MNNNYKIYVDADGVVVNFAKKIKELYPDFIEGVTERNSKMDREMWKAISKYQRNGGLFWYDCEMMPDALELLNFLQPYNFEILTACGNISFGAGQQKLDWVKNYIGTHVIVHLVE